MNDKKDITMHSDDELSMHFMNDEYLYDQARKASTFNEVRDLADDIFTYSTEQMNVLETDYNEGTLT